MKKILIFGGTGMLGSMLSSYLHKCGHDITITARNKIETSYKLIIFDAEKDHIPNEIKHYDWIINCIGVIKQKNNTQPKEYYTANSVFPWKLSLAANMNNVKMIHVSSDCVFDGTLEQELFYSAYHEPNAKDDYGYSKALGEASNCIVLRTSIIGPLKNNYNGLFEWFRNTKDVRVGGYPNHLWTGVTTLELSKIISKIIEKNKYYSEEYDKQQNVFQVSLEKQISKYDLLNKINYIFSIKKEIYENKDVQPINRSLKSNLNCLCDVVENDIDTQLIELMEWEKKWQN